MLLKKNKHQKTFRGHHQWHEKDLGNPNHSAEMKKRNKKQNRRDYREMC